MTEASSCSVIVCVSTSVLSTPPLVVDVDVVVVVVSHRDWILDSSTLSVAL